MDMDRARRVVAAAKERGLLCDCLYDGYVDYQMGNTLYVFCIFCSKDWYLPFEDEEEDEPWMDDQEEYNNHRRNKYKTKTPVRLGAHVHSSYGLLISAHSLGYTQDPVTTITDWILGAQGSLTKRDHVARGQRNTHVLVKTVPADEWLFTMDWNAKIVDEPKSETPSSPPWNPADQFTCTRVAGHRFEKFVQFMSDERDKTYLKCVHCGSRITPT